MKVTAAITPVKEICYHCGEPCRSETVRFDHQSFCCEGCKLVYDLLKENNLCTYYTLNSSPGHSAKTKIVSGKFDYLNNTDIQQKLFRFADEHQAYVVFYLPSMHCSSCVWLLENLHRLHTGIIDSKVDFMKKEITIVYRRNEVKLSAIAELLTNVGYEPLLNLGDIETRKEKKADKSRVIKIGIAGFCFGNIMMLSFPEYFAVGNFYEQKELKSFFGYLNLVLSLPVFFYSASEFYSSAWKSIRKKYLNIDAPIALAILGTFLRSLYEIISQTGVGYLDSMTGIVFFMLIGRYFQQLTHEQLSFDRDYKSYFPVAVGIKNKNGHETSIPVSELQVNDHIIIRNDEIIPVDAVLLSEHTHIDYAFVSGESTPVKISKGESVYAGGRQLGGVIELKVTQPVSQSYLTQLWNNDFHSIHYKKSLSSFTDTINKYFTVVVLLLAFTSAIYWLFEDSTKALNAFTAVLIVACPCGLLLTSTFTNGHLLRVLGKNKFYLKNASVIEKITRTTAMVFDKTGTITHGAEIKFVGQKLNNYQLQLVTSLAAQSAHPLSRKIHEQFSSDDELFKVTAFEEIKGQGIKAMINGEFVILGSEYFVTGRTTGNNDATGKVFLMINGHILGYFGFKTFYRNHLKELIGELKKHYRLWLLSGDNDYERTSLASVFDTPGVLHFNQQPEQKKKFIQSLQEKGHRVMMLGDGLNDAGALQQSDVGIALSDDTNTFSPACDAILDGASFEKIPRFISFCKAGQKAIVFTFIISLTYNIIGLVFALKGSLSPVIAAILMPSSSLSIILLSALSVAVIARVKKL